MATTNAQQQALIAAQQARIAGQLHAAQRESEQRSAPVTGVVAGYDSTTGDYLISTPDGGTIRAQSLTDGALVGLRVPVQRFGDSQTSVVNAKPAQGSNDGAASIESAQRDVVNLLAVETLDFRIDAPEDTTYVLAPYQHYAVRVEALQGVTGGTVTTSPAVGDIAAIGDPISITVSGSDSGTPCLGSILLRRIG
jgi:hypothetical protein